MSKKEKKLENIKQHWLSYPLFICALVEFLWSLENLQFLWFSIFLMCLLVSVCFVWCWIYLWDHLTNNWHFRAYIIKGFCDGWGGGVLYYSHLSFLSSFGFIFSLIHLMTFSTVLVSKTYYVLFSKELEFKFSPHF